MNSSKIRFVVLYLKKNTLTIQKNRYDGVLPRSTNQFQCYKRIAEPLIDTCLEGYNTTVMAYGQTGSGKTYTIGTSASIRSSSSSQDTKSEASYVPESEDGLIPRFVSDLFHRTNALQGRKIDVSVSFLEIYNERIRDLLNPHDEQELKIVEKGRNKRGARVLGLSRHKVSCTKDVLRALGEGVSRRVTCGTKMNTVSSRSHAIMILDLEIRPSEEEEEEDDEDKQKSQDDEKNLQGEVIRSSVTFVDLAGSERLKRTGAVGQRKEEGIHINMGLLALGQVINALADEKRIRSGTSYTFSISLSLYIYTCIFITSTFQLSHRYCSLTCTLSRLESNTSSSRCIGWKQSNCVCSLRLTM